MFAAVPSLANHELHATDLSPTTATRAITPTTAKAASWLRRRANLLPPVGESPPISPSIPTSFSSRATTTTKTGGTSSLSLLQQPHGRRSSTCRRTLGWLLLMITVATLSSLSTIWYIRSLPKKQLLHHISDEIPSIVTTSVESGVLQAVATLGLADHMAAHSGATSEQLAASMSCHAPSLHRLLNYLNSINIVHATCINDTSTCDVSAMSWWLVDGGMTLLSNDGIGWSSWLQSQPHISSVWSHRLVDMIRTGRGQRSDTDDWSPIGVMIRASLPFDWTQWIDWSSYKFIVDVGVGGIASNGTAMDLLLPLLHRYDNIMVVLFRSSNGMRDTMKWFGHRHVTFLRRTQYQSGHWSNGLPLIDQANNGISHVFVFNQILHRVHDDDIVPLLTQVSTCSFPLTVVLSHPLSFVCQ
jgi:hypothetical protein